ncbi:radical SAM protein [Moraxella marmotae]|uniref:radical SAM protein n=1 Tax=Moraxella marmotae TaxID=3344520 RepID=UPI0035F2869B
MLYQHMTYHRIGEKNLFIIPSLPSSVVLDDLETIAFYSFSKEQNVLDTEQFLLSKGIQLPQVKSTINSLLKKLKIAQIYPLSDIQLSYSCNEIYPTDIHLCLTRSCNLRCAHCYISADKEQAGELSLEQWKTGFKAIFEYIKNPKITISGGEPTQKRYLGDLVKFLANHSTVTIFTNGKRNIDDLVPYVAEVQVSLDGITQKTNDTIRGLGSFVKISKFIKNFPDKSKLTVAITLMAHNFDDTKNKLFDFMNAHGLTNSNIRLNAQLEDFGRAENLPSEYKNFYYERTIEIAEFIQSINPSTNNNNCVNKLNCGIGLSIGIDSNGDIYPCDEFVNKMGNILHLNLSSALRKTVKINQETQINNMPYCQKCDLKYICLGGCKAKNLQKTGSYFKPDCSEQKKWAKYVALAYEI